MDQLSTTAADSADVSAATTTTTTTISTTKKRYYQSKYTCFEKFQHSKIAFETKKTYTKYLKEFLNFCHFETYEQLMEMSDSEKHESIMDYLYHLSVEKRLSHTVSMNAYSAIKKFFSINNIKLDWEQINNNCIG
ncbi:MAG TPA: phage integrase N-terminal SAM-like domain-containing protein, partial [Nitrososphaeraceae archaeon]|nr:phage integrase N-terminal SAM-like domain-containing protein [Nitrososphaeraceae archaeon]